MKRWHLAFVYLLTGSAFALAVAMFTTVVAVELITPITTLRAIGLTVGTIAMITLTACLPQIRQIEGVMVTALLGADIGQQPSPSRNTEETLGSVLWFWLHLLAGAINGAALIVLGAGGVLATLSPIVLDPGTEIVGIPVLTTTGTRADVRLVVLGPIMVLTWLSTALASAQVLRNLAPRLLGPSLESQLEAIRVATAAVTNRQALARELHDSLGHSLSAIVIQSALARKLGTGPAETLDSIDRAAQTALHELDTFLGRLRQTGSESDETDLPTLDDVPALLSVARAAGHKVSMPAAEMPELPAVISHHAYRVVQEAVTNVIRHAPGQPVEVTVRPDHRRLLIQVTNGLSGARLARSERPGRGLDGMRERVAALGGLMEICEAAESWTVSVTLPLPRRASTRARRTRRRPETFTRDQRT